MINELFKNRNKLNRFIQQLRSNSDALSVFMTVMFPEIVVNDHNDDLPF